MLRSFYKKFSLDNLQNDRPKGQIATILILIMVVVLILILTTVNLGQLSISSTNLLNVADSASLYMASQLASRGNQISYSLQHSNADDCGPLSACTRGGFGGLFGAIIGAIIAVVIIVVSWGYATPAVVAAYGSYFGGAVIAAGAIGGAVGGAVGAKTAGTSVLQGAFTGLMIGAAIGAGVSSIVAAPATGAGAGGAGSTVTLEGGYTGTMVQGASDVGVGIGGSTPVVLPGSTSAAAGAGVLGTSPLVGASLAGLSTASSIYNAYVSDQNQAAAFAAASQMLNGLPDYDMVRESVFLQVFSQTVDDPNKDTDADDLNGNGDTADKVSHFLTWWGGRVNYLKGIIPPLQSITSAFFKNALPAFNSDIAKELSVTQEFGYGDSDNPSPQIIGRLSKEGNIAKVGQALKTSFSDPQADGSFDSVVSGFNNFKSISEQLSAIDINQLTANWQTYIGNFYNSHYGESIDGKTVTDYYHKLEDTKNVLKDWKKQIVDRRNALPLCKIGALYYSGGDSGVDSCQPCYFSTYCANDCIIKDGPDMSPVPCKLGFTLQGASLDYNIDDEITPALNDIDALVSRISNFQEDIFRYVKEMQDTYAAHESGYGGLNPATYNWTDSRGAHSVKAQVSDYQLARTITTESGGSWSKTVCIRLVDYSGTASVEITRQDPQSKDLKSGKVSLGMWNPFFNGIIKKKSGSSYSYNTVSLAQ